MMPQADALKAHGISHEMAAYLSCLIVAGRIPPFLHGAELGQRSVLWSAHLAGRRRRGALLNAKRLYLV